MRIRHIICTKIKIMNINTMNIIIITMKVSMRKMMLIIMILKINLILILIIIDYLKWRILMILIMIIKCIMKQRNSEILIMMILDSKIWLIRICFYNNYLWLNKMVWNIKKLILKISDVMMEKCLLKL
jgi:hypothetical protein